MKKFIFPSIAIVISIACFSALFIIGNHVDNNGVLQEPFDLLYLISIGNMFFLLGLIWFGGILITNFFLPIATMIIGITCYGAYHWIEPSIDLFVLLLIGCVLVVTSFSWIMILAVKRVKAKFFK